MKKKITYWLVALAVFTSAFCHLPSAFGQSLSPQLIGTTGNYSPAAFGSISYSVGEPVVTTTSLVGGIQLTQGFQQPTAACPTASQLTVTPSLTVCNGTTVTITAQLTPPTGSYTYFWSSGETTSAIKVAPTVTTAYTFSVVGCSLTVHTETITVNPVPSATITAAPSLTICEGSQVTLTGSGGSVYVWNTGVTATTINVSPSSFTTYSVIASAAGCSDTATVDVHVNPAPFVDINVANPFVKTICQGDVVTLDATFLATNTYAWLPVAGLNIPNIHNPMASPTTSTEYTVTLTDSNGCSAVATASLTVSTPMILAASSTTVSCSASCDGSASINTSGGIAPYSYAWSGGGNSSAVSNLCAQSYTVNVSDGAGCSASTTVTVASPAPLTATTTITQPNCGCNGQATATPSGGTGSYTYSWDTSPAQTTATITGICSGPHIVTVTDNNLCSTSANVNFTGSPGVTVTVTSPVTICAGNSASMVATATSPTGTPAYAWSPAATLTNANISNPVADPTTTTTYTVIVSNSLSGCADTAFVPVTVSPTPTVNISGTTTICSGQSATLGASAGSGATYLWNPGGQTDAVITTAALTSPTTFTVTATNTDGCSADGNISVSLTPSPAASISVGPSTSICNGATVTLTAGGGNTYFWINNSLSVSSFTDTPSANTTYTLVAYNGTCSDTAYETVNVSNFSAVISITNSDSILCLGDNTILTATSGATYLWNPGGGTTQSIPISPTNTTPYFVTVTSSGGCVGTDSILVTVNAAPTAIISASATTICQFQPVTLTASGGNSYSWNTGSTNGAITVNPSAVGNNNYSVTVTNGGCSGDTSINIFANALPNISAVASSDSICPGDSVVLTATGGAGIVYNWISLGSGAVVTDFPTASLTTYTVIGTDPNTTCSNFATASVALNSVSVNAGPDITICPGYTADLSANVSGTISGINYLWSPDSLLNNPLIANPSANPTDSATQFVVYVTNGLCNASDSLIVYAIRTPDCIIHIYNGFTPNSDLDNAVWHIDGIQSYPENKVLIFNRWGSKVWGANGYNNKDVVWKGTDEHGRAVPDGTYYYLIELYDGKGGTIFSRSEWVEVTH